MATVVLPLDAASGSPSYSAQATRQAFSAVMGVAPSGRSLGATSGVRPGTPTNTVNTAAGAFTWSVGAHSGVLDVETSPFAGPYLYATDGNDKGTITAADATNPRVDIVYVQVNDNVQDGSGSEAGVVGYLAGTPAASPVAPAAPARSMVLAQISVPKSGGGNPTVSWVAPTFGATPWQSYTPVLTNWALGNGTLVGRYAQSGKTIHYSVYLQLGSTSTMSGTFFVSLPFTPEASNGAAYTPVGTYHVLDTSASQDYAGFASCSGANNARLTYSSNQTVTATAPITFASGDIIRIVGTYESA